MRDFAVNTLLQVHFANIILILNNLEHDYYTDGLQQIAGS